MDEDAILTADMAVLMQVATPMLQAEDSRLATAALLVRRLQTNAEEEQEFKKILRLLATTCSSDQFLLDMMLELLMTVEHKVPVINSIALAAAGSSAEQLSPVLDTYRDLLNSDRDLLVPIIGSISELDLSISQRESFLELISGSLKVVKDQDVPVVVNAMLQITTQSNACHIAARMFQLKSLTFYMDL
ncbi:hypothetical protein GUITHDRAFT_156053, partial [Guillardia theta CCMP2712]